LNGKPFRVAGVLPPDFVFPPITLGEAVIQPELYVPLETRSPMMRDRGAPFMMAIARLAPGGSAGQRAAGSDDDCQASRSVVSAGERRARRRGHSITRTGCGQRAKAAPASARRRSDSD